MFSWEEGPQEASAPVVTSRSGNTLAARLTADAGLPGLTARGEGSYNDAHLYVVPESQICLRIYGEEDTPLEGVTVQIQDCLMDNAPVLTATTDESGRVILNASDFSADFENELDLCISADPTALGYRELYVSHCYLFRGEIRTFYTKKLDSPAPQKNAAAEGAVLLSSSGAKPYIYSARFKNYDILYQDFEMIFSSLNDWEFDITVIVKNPGGGQYDPPVMHYYQAVGLRDDNGLRDVEPTSMTKASYGDVYVFRGRWKQLILPEGTEKPYFTLGDEKVKTLLKSVRTAADQPMILGDEPNSPLSNLLKNGFGFTFTIPVGNGIKCEFNLPMNKGDMGYWPKITYAGTSVSIIIGSNFVGEPGHGVNWESRELKDYNKETKKFEKGSKAAKKLGELGEAYKYYKNNKLKFMQKTSLDFGLFLMLSVVWPADKQAGTRLVSVDGAFGVFVKFAYDMTAVYALGPLPGYVNFNFSISVGFAFELKVDMLLRDGKLSEIKFYPLRSFTIDLRIGVTLTFGAGVKGIASLWFRGSVMLNIILAVNAAQPNRVAVLFEATLTVGFELLFINYSYNIIKPYKRALYDKYYGSASRFTLFDVLMSTALADEVTEELNTGEQTPDTYPALRPTLKTDLDPRFEKDQTSAGHIRTVGVGDQDYLFFIHSVKGKDGAYHQRLCWTFANETYHTLNSFQPSMESLPRKNEISQFEDGDFDVISTDGFVFVSAVSYGAFDDGGEPVRGQKQWAYIAVLAPDEENGGLRVINFTVLDDIANNKNYCYDSLGTPSFTHAAVTGKNDILLFKAFLSFPRYPYKDGGRGTGIFCLAYSAECQRITDPRWPTVYNMNDPLLTGRSDKNVSIGMGKGYERVKSMAFMDWFSNFPRVDGILSLTMPKDGAEGDSAIEITFDPTDGGQSAIVLDRGSIEDFVVVSTPDAYDPKILYTDVFYAPWVSKTLTDSETGEEYEVGSYRLRCLHIEPREQDPNDSSKKTFRVTKFDYDIALPSSRLRAATFGGMSYLYWTSGVSDPENSENMLYRLDCVAYDPGQNTMSDVTTLAELDLPKVYYYITKGYRLQYRQPKIEDIDLTDHGMAYVSARPMVDENDDEHTVYMTHFSFPVPLTPVLSLRGTALEDDTVRPGTMLGVNYALMNEGNMGVGAFDIEMYTLGTDGKEGPLVQTLHADLLDVRRSSLVEAGTGKVLARGTAALTRAEDYVYGGKQRDWVVSSEGKTYTTKSGKLVSTADSGSDAQYVRTEMIVPGALAALNSTLFIPYTWSGDIDIRLRLTNITAYSNWSGVMAAVANARAAQRSALLANGMPAVTSRGGESLVDTVNTVMDGGLDVDSIISGVEGAHRLYYEYDDASGKLVLQKLVSRDGEDIDYDLYAGEIDAPDQDFALNIEGNDLEVGHRLYYNAEDEYMLDIVLVNFAGHGGTDMRLTCAMYLDGSEEPIYVNLPYDADKLASGRTQTISLPLASLLDPEAHKSASFEIRGIGFEETAYANNQFSLFFDSADPLRFSVQPADVTARQGTDAVFTVQAAGGSGGYTYRWQMYDGSDWWDITGENTDVLTMKGVRPDMSGKTVRCVVTDSAGAQAVSGGAVLTVSSPAPTGDSALPFLYLGIALIALGLIAVMLRRMRKAAK